MPRYAYRCDACKSDFEVTHGMFFIQERCIKCHSHGFLTKIPDFRISKKIENSTTKPGQIVDNFIEEAKEDLKKQKKEAQKEIKK
tara:strand:+ start:91 stop:345 length:255 start_codon:yes stop_codon:yes gene_type:complete